MSTIITSPRLVSYGLIVILAGLAYLPAAGNRAALDEGIWISNGIKFQQALLRGEWELTRQATRPGVSVMWVSGAVAQAVFGTQTLLETGPDDLDSDPRLIQANRIAFSVLKIAGAIALLFFLRQLLSSGVALLTAALAALHPLLVNPFALVWTDALLVFFFALSLLSFAVHILRERRQYLYFAGLLFGAALLTKTIALLIPFLFVTTSLWGKRRGVLQHLKDVGIATVCGLAVFYLLYPAAWYSPGLIVDRAGEVEIAAPAPVSENQQTLPLAWLFENIVSASPVIMLGAVVVLIATFVMWLRGERHDELTDLFLLWSIVYIGALYLVSFAGDHQAASLQSERYTAPVLPLLVAGIIRFLSLRSRDYGALALPAGVLLIIAEYVTLSLS